MGVNSSEVKAFIPVAQPPRCERRRRYLQHPRSADLFRHMIITNTTCAQFYIDMEVFRSEEEET